MSTTCRFKMYTRCSLCGEEGHRLTKCSILIDPLNSGFSGANGGGGGDHDHDDEESLSHDSGKRLGLWCSDQSSGYTTVSISPKTAAHQLNELFEITAPARQVVMTSRAVSSLGSSQKITVSF